MLFEDLSLSKSIQRAVYEQGYTNPPHSRAIYSASTSREGFNVAQTGTGKQQHLPYLLYINFVS
jgi:ATP-dependent RNA helicase RhlE